MGQLFDKLVQSNHLLTSFHLIKDKWFDDYGQRYRHGSSGLDGLSLRDFEANLEDELERCRRFFVEQDLDFHPQILCRIPKETPGKFRELYLLSVRDKVLHRAMAEILDPLLNRLYYPNLFSFRRGKYYGIIPAVRKVRKFLEGARGKAIVFKADVSSYYDSIDHGLLMQKFRALLPDEPEFLRFLEKFVHQRRFEQGLLHSPLIGVPTGSSLSPLCANFFLNELDQAMFRGGFDYLRFCDDLLLMATDEGKIAEGRAIIEEILAKQRLALSPKKTHLYRPGEAFEYLGYRFEGTGIHIGSANLNNFRAWVLELLPTHRYSDYPNKTPEERRQLLKVILDDIYEGTFKPQRERQLNWIRSFKMVNDDRTLRQMDAYLKNRIRILITRKASRRNFRQVPEAWFRELGYRSLTGAYYRVLNRRSLLPYLRFRKYIGGSFESV